MGLISLLKLSTSCNIQFLNQYIWTSDHLQRKNIQHNLYICLSYLKHEYELMSLGKMR